MKRFVLVALSLSIGIIPIAQNPKHPSAGVANKESRADVQHAEDARDKQQSTETAALNSILAAMTKNEQERTAERQQDASDVKETIKAEWWLVCVGIAQAIALILTLVAIGIQAKKTADTVQAMQDSLPLQKSAADAAFLNAQAVINSERAWFLFDDTKTIEVGEFGLGNPKKFMARVYFKNFGKTVGKQMAFQFGLYVTALNEVPSASAYDLTEIFKPIVIPQGDPLPHLAELKNNGGIIARDDWADFVDHPTKSLWLCGIIKYETFLGRDSNTRPEFAAVTGDGYPNRIPFFSWTVPLNTMVKHKDMAAIIFENIHLLGS